MKPPEQPDSTNLLSGSGTNRSFYLQRLPREYYQGDAVVHWTMPIANRGTGWLNDAFHAHFREIMLHTAAREGLFCPTYCLMSDHIHLVWMGMRRESDQRNGIKFLREHLARGLHAYRFQHQAHDHALRAEQRKRNTFAKVCFYIMDMLAELCRVALESEGLMDLKYRRGAGWAKYTEIENFYWAVATAAKHRLVPITDRPIDYPLPSRLIEAVDKNIFSTGKLSLSETIPNQKPMTLLLI